MANYMKEVATILGVELDEEFETVVDGFCRKRAKLTKYGLEYLNHSGNWEDGKCYLICLLTGMSEVIKLPWKPTFGEVYWTYSTSSFYPSQHWWDNWPHEQALQKCGMIFRTKEEALRERPRIYKEVTGREWEEETS